MADATFVFSPGLRLEDPTSGDFLSGATIEFYDAGTTNPKTVYADAGLLTSLGTSVTTDSQGYPTSDGSNKTLVWVGTADYKMVIKNSAGTTIATHDNVKGAVETVESSDASVVATRPVETKSLDYTVLSADQSKVFAGNCSGGDVTFTLPSAVTVGSGWLITIQHAGTANEVFIASVSSQTITEGASSFGTSYALVRNGDEVTLVSDGGNWRVVQHSVPQIKVATGIITVADRLNNASTPAAGDWNIVTSGPTGDFSTFAEHDLVFYTGAAWVKFTPPTDCGWVAYVKDEDKYYRFISSAWVSESASDTVAGSIEIATADEMETATDTVRAVVPGRVHNHPGVAKFWAKVTYSGGTPTLAASYNVTSITDTAEGSLAITIGTDFSSANWCCVVSCTEDGSSARIAAVDDDVAQAAGTVQIRVRTTASNPADPPAIFVAGFGDQ